MEADSLTPEPTPRVPPVLAKVIEVGARMNQVVPEAVALGGAVCALYAQHRLSLDIDFVLENLREQFDEVRDRLLDQPGWLEARIRPPHLILGSLEDVEVGFRQLRRQAPIETQQVPTAKGPLTIPTFEEMLRIKALLAYERDAVRDFVDFAELAARRPRESVVGTLLSLDEKMGWERQPAVMLEVIKTLVECEPRDLQAQAFETFRFLEPRLKSWPEVKAVCQDIGRRLAEKAIRGPGDAP
jgi:hypothetical protein